ncbi:MAG TPA: radical SAM family heme chaperone HemW, partial [Bdellovibrionota bacterium]|nr:radical SAM family heme chaperone HemW [Bdellovibrionota bacterium]
MTRSLYVHFPFCEAKCHYCDFYSLGRERTKASDPEVFAEALAREAALQAPKLDAELDTVFFGGGTPSMTPAHVMARALEPILTPGRITPRTEWTMEANPSSIELGSMREYRALGVNRVSMGVQALENDFLKRLGRVHDGKAALSALEAVFAAGFDNVSVDLLCGVPGQAVEDLDRAMRTLSSFPITHLSCYLLTLPPHHRMYKELPGEDEQLRHLLFIDRFMSEAGFEHYEISNFSRPGKRAAHNLVYWKGGSYLGLGPSAHSFDAATGTRWKNVSSLHRYAALLGEGRLPTEHSEWLTPEQ